MKKVVVVYNVILISIFVIMGFISSTTVPQLLSSILFFPIAVYFWQIIIPKTKHPIPPVMLKKSLEKKEPKKSKKSKGSAKEEVTQVKLITQKQGFDLNRRTFLRLIGSAGVSVFLLSIFSGKAEAAFFGSVPGPGTVSIKNTSGVQIDPAEKKPTDGYNISNVDDSIPSYYGYIEKNGGWYIIKEDATGAYRYAKGASNFSTNWTNRASLTYDYFDSVF